MNGPQKRSILIRKLKEAGIYKGPRPLATLELLWSTHNRTQTEQVAASAFEEMLNNIRALPALDEEADTFREVAELLFDQLTKEQRETFLALPRVRVIAERANNAAAEEGF